MTNTKLNVACGSNIKPGWINIDKYYSGGSVLFGDITKIPYNDNEVDEIMCNYIFEHLNFFEEKKAFYEVTRVLKIGGKLTIKVPDFEDTVKKWLNAKDEWKGFYKKCDTSDPEYGFGWGQSMESKWGIIMTHIFGSHISNGLFHINAYTENKLKSILEYMKYENINIQRKLETDRGYPIVALIAESIKK